MGGKGISVIPPRRPDLTRIATDVTLHSSGVIGVNLCLNDTMEGRERCYAFVLSRTAHEAKYIDINIYIYK
jgi:hypothetical protein